MKYSWNHLNVQILPPCLWMSCTLHSSRAQLSATQVGYFKLLKMHFLVGFSSYKYLLYSTCYFCIKSACCICRYHWNYFDSTFPIILPLEKINIFEKGKKMCKWRELTENQVHENWVVSISPILILSAFQGENYPWSYSNLHYSTGTQMLSY